MNNIIIGYTVILIIALFVRFSREIYKFLRSVHKTMEKKRYELEIADVEMAIISDEREDFVMRLANELDSGIRYLLKHNKRCSKLDAAILCALDYASDKLKAEKRVRNLEAQVALYDANIRRLREEVARLKGETYVGPAVKTEEPENSDVEDLKAIDGAEDAAEEKAEEAETAVQLGIEEAAPAEETKNDTFRKIDELLTRRAIEGDKPETARENKLRQIENLLRNK